MLGGQSGLPSISKRIVKFIFLTLADLYFLFEGSSCKIPGLVTQAHPGLWSGAGVGVRNTMKRLDSGFRRNDGQGLLPVALGTLDGRGLLQGVLRTFDGRVWIE
jgi:hypothetical protein